VSTQPISDERPKPCPKCGHEFMHYPWCEDDPVQKVGLPSILDIPADPFECLYRYIGLWDGVPKDEYEAALAALVAVRAERDQATTALRALWDDLGPKEQRYVDLAVEALVRDVLEAGGRQKPPVVSEATDETLKRNVLGLADHHRATCDGPDCTVSLALLGVLLDRASIGVTEEEARRLW
jgi:hypothetical protein